MENIINTPVYRMQCGASDAYLVPSSKNFLKITGIEIANKKTIKCIKELSFSEYLTILLSLFNLKKNKIKNTMYIGNIK